MPVVTRDFRLSVRLRPKQLLTVKQAAHSQGETVAGWARQVVLQAAALDLAASPNGRRAELVGQG